MPISRQQQSPAACMVSRINVYDQCFTGTLAGAIATTVSFWGINQSAGKLMLPYLCWLVSLSAWPVEARRPSHHSY